MPQSDSTRPSPAREATEGLRKLASAFGMMVETAFPRETPKPADDEGIDTVSYPETATLAVTVDLGGDVVSVRYGAIELPYTMIKRSNPLPLPAPSPIVSIRIRQRRRPA